AQKLNTAKQLYLDGKTDDLKDFLAKNLPESHFSYEKFTRMFERPTNPWNKEEPFQVVPSGQTTYQLDKAGYESRYGNLFKNEHDSEYNLMKSIDRRFLGSRDPRLWAIKDL